jgi:hypothetical protein
MEQVSGLLILSWVKYISSIVLKLEHDFHERGIGTWNRFQKLNHSREFGLVGHASNRKWMGMLPEYQGYAGKR